MWLLCACGSALFAGLTAILAKCGVRKTDSDIATGIRTFVVLGFAWGIVFLTGAWKGLGAVQGKTLLFLILSGLATGASWLCYFKALSLGEVNKVTAVDKSGIALAVIAGILFFHETAHWPRKLVCTALITAGALMMVGKLKTGSAHAEKRAWLFYAFFSAVFAAATSLLAKIGFAEIDANLGTAVRTIVILAMAWLIVGFRKKWALLKAVPRGEIVFLVLSGVTTGVSWLCYFYAIQKGEVSVVVPIDRLSLLVSVLFARFAFQERLSPKAAAGLFLMTAGTIGIAL